MREREKKRKRNKGNRRLGDQKNSFKAKFKWFGLKHLDPLGITLLKRVAAAATKTLRVFSRNGSIVQIIVLILKTQITQDLQEFSFAWRVTS